MLVNNIKYSNIQINTYTGRWKDYPVNVTAYSYFFGSIFMGMLSVYFAATKQYSKFHLPDDVSKTDSAVAYD